MSLLDNPADTIYVSGSVFDTETVIAVSNEILSNVLSVNGQVGHVTIDISGVGTTGIDLSKYYTNDNPSGFITSENVLYATGNQTISGAKTFAHLIKADSIVGIQEGIINLGPYYFNSGEGAYRPPFNIGEIVFVEHLTGSAYYNPDLFATELEEKEVVIVNGIVDTNDEIRLDPYYTGLFPSKWSDLNGRYVKTSVAVTPSITEPSWLSGLGMHTPESGTFNYYFKSYLNPDLDGISYFLAPGNRCGWGSDPDEDALTDTPVNYWRLCSLSDWPFIFFTNPSTDPYTFPLTGWVPVDPDATPPENQGSAYLTNYSGGFTISTGSYALSGSYALYINTFNSNGENNHESLSILTGANIIFSLEQNGNTAVYKTNSVSFGYTSYGSGIIYNDRTYEYSTALTLLKAAGTEFISGDPIYIRIGNSNSGSNFSIISGSAIFGGNLQSNTATFNNRPTVNGIGVLLSGEAAELPETIVYLTGDQTISGIKTFNVRPTVNGTGVLLSGDVTNGGTANFRYTPVSGTVNFLSNQRYSINTNIPSDCRISGFNPTNPDPELQAYFAENPDTFLADGVYVYDGLINNRPSYKLNINPNWRLEWFSYGDNAGEWRLQNTVTQAGVYGFLYPEYPPDPWDVEGPGAWDGLENGNPIIPNLIVEELKNTIGVLPANPEAGDEIELYDIGGTWDTNSLIVDNNGNHIEQKLEQLECNVKNGLIKLIYTPTNNIGWKIYPMPTHNIENLVPPLPAIATYTISGYAPLTAQFSGINLADQAISPVDHWYWDVSGDSIAEFDQSVITYVFNETGTYTFYLTAINSAGSGMASGIVTVLEV